MKVWFTPFPYSSHNPFFPSMSQEAAHLHPKQRQQRNPHWNLAVLSWNAAFHAHDVMNLQGAPLHPAPQKFSFFSTFSTLLGMCQFLLTSGKKFFSAYCSMSSSSLSVSSEMESARAGSALAPTLPQ